MVKCVVFVLPEHLLTVVCFFYKNIALSDKSYKSLGIQVLLVIAKITRAYRLYVTYVICDKTLNTNFLCMCRFIDSATTTF